MSAVHPLRPLALALSLRLNDPRGLLHELEAIEPPAPLDPNGLAHHAYRAATCLARSAELFVRDGEPSEASEIPAFVENVQYAATHLATVADMPWGTDDHEGEARMRAACLDIALGCLTLAGGRVRRPDVNNFLTNVVKAIPSRSGRMEWRFASLPQYDEAPVVPKP